MKLFTIERLLAMFLLAASGASAQVVFRTYFIGTVSDVGVAVNDGVAALSSGGVIVIGKSGTLLTQATLGTANITIECWPGVTLTRGFAPPSGDDHGMIYLSAANTKVRNCIIDGAGASYVAGIGIRVTGADDAVIEGNTIQNHDRFGILVTGTSRSRIENNHTSGNESIDFFFEKDALDTIVRGNQMVCGTDPAGLNHCISFHATTPGMNVSNAIITNNNLQVNTGFCVEVGGFAGTDVDIPDNVVISNNICRVIGSNGAGYSISGATNVAITGNVHDAGVLDSGRGVELAFCTRCTVSGNALYGNSRMSIGISVDQSAESVVTGNLIDRWQPLATYGGIEIINVANTRPVRNNLIADNVLIAPSTGAVIGIKLNCSVNGTDCSNNQIIGNTIIGNDVASSYGVQVGGAVSPTGLVIRDNYLRDWNVGVQVNSPTSAALVESNHYFSNTVNLNDIGLDATDLIRDDSMLFANLNASTVADGSTVWCQDCTETIPCTSGSTVVKAFREGGAWNCFGVSAHQNKIIEQYGTGTSYVLTGTSALINLGGNDPQITINEAGTWLLQARAYVYLNGATFPANRFVKFVFRRTNNTPADLLSTDAVACRMDFDIPVVTTVTQGLIIMEADCVYATTNTNDIIALFGYVSTLPTAGTIEVPSVGSYMRAVKLFR